MNDSAIHGRVAFKDSHGVVTVGQTGTVACLTAHGAGRYLDGARGPLGWLRAVWCLASKCTTLAVAGPRLIVGKGQ
jgi:hypothetical protein